MFHMQMCNGKLCTLFRKIDYILNAEQRRTHAIFLQGAATKLQELGEFLVGEVSLPVQRWAVGLDE